MRVLRLQRVLNLPKSKRGKVVLGLLPGLLLAAAICYFAGLLAHIYIVGGQDSARESDVIVVAGATLRRDGRPGRALTRRSQHAASLWQVGIADRIICAGGQADRMPMSEAAACREILARSGVPRDAVILEERSRSTEENAINSAAIMRELGMESAALVTDDCHILRASWLFRRQGLDVSASPVPACRYSAPGFLGYALRELAAINWQLFKDALGLPMTHLPGV